MSFVANLVSSADGATFPANEPQTVHKNRPLLVQYDLDRVGKALDEVDFTTRPSNMWRYRELLPSPGPTMVDPSDPNGGIVTLGEGMTPMIRTGALARHLKINHLFIKDESQSPTGSFKSRGMSVAVTMAKSFGIKRVAVPSAGNAGGALAAYAARAGLEAFIFMPADTPAVNIFEAQLAGAKVFLVDGLITDCGRIVREGIERMGWFDLSTMREPYRIEGKKTMGLEIAEQFGWSLPNVIVFPTGGGTGLIGMWKAFLELVQLGLVDEDELPRMVAVQSDGCCPIVRAFESGAETAEPFANASTIARGLRVPASIGDALSLNALRQSNGAAIAVQESRIPEWMQTAARLEGVSVGPESATCIGAVEQLRDARWISRNDVVVIFNSAAAQKTHPNLGVTAPTISKDAIDWSLIEG